MRDDNKSVLVRVDANRERGIGHAMRCFAVSEALIARGFRVTFAVRELPNLLLPRLAKANISIHRMTPEEDVPAGIIALAQNLDANYLILDGYHLCDTIEKHCAQIPLRTLRFDDYLSADKCHADVVVNASPHADVRQYSKWAPNAQLLLGPRFIAFRSDMVSKYKERQRKLSAGLQNGVSTTILVNFGGSDPLDMTIDTVKALAEAIPDAPIEAVTGAAYPNPERLSKLDLTNFTHHHNTDNLSEIIQRARLAISAGGLTVQELALFQIPTILAITAENQIKAAHVSWCHTLRLDWLQRKPSTATIIEEIVQEACMLWASPEERDRILHRIPRELDTNGADRIADALIIGS